MSIIPSSHFDLFPTPGIGGSVDQTGNVIVSAAIISEEATEVAGIVKMVLNAGMGVMASVIACYWSVFRTNDDDGAVPKFSLVMLWDKVSL